jgi:hypothetical protein
MRVKDRPRTRREQIETDFLRRLKRALKRLGIILPDEAIEHVREALKSAAMVGAAEERSHALRLLHTPPITPRTLAIERQLISRSIKEVLGYED